MLAASCLAFASLGAHAAGHFDVDDAGTLDPGQCQYETWWGRAGAEPVTGFHFGPACRVGPVELGLNLDRNSVGGVHSVTGGPQVKWNFLGQAPDAPFSAALSASTVSDFKRGGRTGGQFVVPMTWRPASSLQVHMTLGADARRRALQPHAAHQRGREHLAHRLAGLARLRDRAQPRVHPEVTCAQRR